LNEESVIAQCLASLKQQKLPSASFEVIVVDNGSTDRTREIARSFGGWLPVTVLERSGVRISALRNFGAAMARGEFLAFLDADCVAPHHWLQQIVDLLHADEFPHYRRAISHPGRLLLGRQSLVWRFVADERWSRVVRARRRPGGSAANCS
jgi:glycosyltransferase involved in cell wall biosynthesis